MNVEIYVGISSVEGKDPPFPDEFMMSCTYTLESTWEEEDFEYKRHPGTDSTPYTVYGKPGTKAGNGGDGGKQGNPGLAGKIMIFELAQATNLNTYAIDGKHTCSNTVRI